MNLRNKNKLKIIAATVVLLHGTFYFMKPYIIPTTVKKVVSK